MPEHRSTHAKLSIDPGTGEVEARELHIVSDVDIGGPHSLASLDLTAAFEALDALDEAEQSPDGAA